MKLIILILAGSIFSIAAIAQVKNISPEPNTINNTYTDYQLLKHFLSLQKTGMLVNNISPHWNSKLFQLQLEEWLIANRKKESAEAILVNNSHVIQTMPVNYGIKDLMWISPAKRYSYWDREEYINASFGNRVARDIINGIGSGVIKNISKKKYHYSAAENNKPNQKPSFLQF